MDDTQGFTHLTPAERSMHRGIATTIVGDEKRMPESIRNAIDSLPADLQYAEESELKSKHNYSVTDERIRQAFWKAVARTNKTGAVLMVSTMLRGVCTDTYFYNKFLKNPLRVAWMLSPVIRYESQVEALLSMALTRYHEVIEMDITSSKKVPIIKVNPETGKETVGFTVVTEIDVAKAKLVLDTLAKLEDRVKGTAIQKSVSITDTKPEGASVEDLDMDAIEDRLKELRAKAGVRDIDAESKEII